MSNVSIIISNYNYGKFVLDAIDSALSQTHKCSVVIVDDGSTDDSVKDIHNHLSLDSIIIRNSYGHNLQDASTSTS